MQPKIIKMDKRYIIGLFGQRSKQGGLWKEINERYAENPFNKTDKYDCSIYFWGKNPVAGKNIFFGFESDGAAEVDADVFTKIELPACEWAIFEVKPAQWWKVGDKEVEGWIANNETYRWRKFNGAVYQLEYYKEKFKGARDPDSLMEVWYPLERHEDSKNEGDTEKVNSIPIFEQGTKEQKANKPAIEDVCEYFLKDEVLKAGMARLLELSREVKMKPGWMQRNGFKCTYKGKGVVSYVISGNRWRSDLVISVTLADKKDLHNVVTALPDDLRAEFIKERNITHCGKCSAASCDFGAFVEISGEKHWFCSRFNYMCKNPTAEQFKMIEQFIQIRRDYIDKTK